MSGVLRITAVKVENIQGPCISKDEWGHCREYAFPPCYKYTTADDKVYQLCFAPNGNAPHGVPAYIRVDQLWQRLDWSISLWRHPG